jgi:hypothetical protein
MDTDGEIVDREGSYGLKSCERTGATSGPTPAFGHPSGGGDLVEGEQAGPVIEIEAEPVGEGEED